MSLSKIKHFVIPDTQVRPGVDISHLNAIGNYILNQKPDVIVQLGDFADMHSLSSYDVGTVAGEGARYQEDIRAAQNAMKVLMDPIVKYNEQRASNKKSRYRPRMVLTLGNHENRINRHVNQYPVLYDYLSTDNLGYKEQGWEVHNFLDVVEIDGILYCLTPNHEVLMRDLTYKKLEDVNVGEKIIGFTEFPENKKFRRFTEAEITSKHIVEAEVFRVTLTNGKQFDVTENHRWLSRFGWKGAWKWVTTKELTTSHQIPKIFDKWEFDRSYEAGWLAGLYDGEGYISVGNGHKGSGIQVGISQNPGPILDEISKQLQFRNHKFRCWESSEGGCSNIRLGGNINDKVRLLAEIRPKRLLNKFNPSMLGSLQLPDKTKPVFVESIIYKGKEDVVAIGTTTNTMIVDGYPHHNCHYFPRNATGRIVQTYRGAPSAQAQVRREMTSCTSGHLQGLDFYVHQTARKRMYGIIAGSCYLHEEDYLSPQGTMYWRGVVVKHEVTEGMYDPMFVSLDYLLNNWWDGKTYVA